MIIPFMMQLSGNALISYYLALVLDSIGIVDSKTQLVINGTLQIWGFLIAVACSMLVDKAGRRPLFLIGMAGMLGAYIIWTILSARAQQTNYDNKGLSGGVLLMIYIFQFFYLMEISPFSLRSKTSMIYSLNTQISSIFNGFVNPVALKNIGWKYYIVYCVVLACEFVIVYFFFPETKGYGLEEVAVLFDGNDAVVGNGLPETSEDEKLGGTLTQLESVTSK